MDEGEDRGVPLRGEAGGRVEEHCTDDPPPEHGLLEADHRASRRESGHTVVRVPSLSSASVWRLHMAGFNKAQEETEQLVVVRDKLKAVWQCGRRCGKAPAKLGFSSRREAGGERAESSTAGGSTA